MQASHRYSCALLTFLFLNPLHTLVAPQLPDDGDLRTSDECCAWHVSNRGSVHVTALLESFLLEDIRKNFFLERVVRHWKRAAWGSGGVPMPGGTGETCGCGTEGQGLVVGAR